MQLSNEMGNMSSAMAIFSGLQTAAVQRLQETWINLDLQSWKYMNSLVAQFCMDGNYAAARQDIAKRSAPFIPFVGAFVSIHTIASMHTIADSAAAS